jgi:hypothetical protein
MASRTVSGWGQLFEVSRRTEDLEASGQERRLWLRYLCDVATSYEPAGEPSCGPLSARIRNISRRGISLLVDRPLDSGAILRVELPGAPASACSSLLACVVHVSPEPAGKWALGCSFVDELTDEELEPFGAERVQSTEEEQRAWVRFPCDVPASYRPMRIKERQRRPARVVDLSVCGAGVVVADPIEIGTVLDLQLERQAGRPPLRLLACVVRATQREGKVTLGCNFIRQIGERELETLCGRAHLPVSHEPYRHQHHAL